MSQIEITEDWIESVQASLQLILTSHKTSRLNPVMLNYMVNHTQRDYALGFIFTLLENAYGGFTCGLLNDKIILNYHQVCKLKLSDRQFDIVSS